MPEVTFALPTFKMLNVQFFMISTVLIHGKEMILWSLFHAHGGQILLTHCC